MSKKKSSSNTSNIKPENKPESKPGSKSRSNKDWHHKQNKDPYVKKSRKEGYRSRAAYKLLEINEKDHILKEDMIVVDLGATPGGWSQVASEIVGERGMVVALDLLPLEAFNNPKYNNVYFIQGDFTDNNTYDELLAYLNSNNLENKVDVVISDMAPNLTGIDSADQAKSAYLVELAYDFAQQVLKPKGSFIAKAFQGNEFTKLCNNIKQAFNSFHIRKPDASRSESKEVYLLGKGYHSYNKKI